MNDLPFAFASRSLSFILQQCFRLNKKKQQLTLCSASSFATSQHRSSVLKGCVTNRKPKRRVLGGCECVCVCVRGDLCVCEFRELLLRGIFG